MSISNFDLILIPDPEHTILQQIAQVQTFQDELEILFNTIPSQVIHGLLFALIETINNTFYFFLINYERNGGDPMKRSVKNRLMAQTGYVMILSNLIVTPTWFWRAFWGPLDPWIASVADAFRQSALTWLTLCFSEGILIKAVMTLKWSRFLAIDEEYWGNFLCVVNCCFSVISHLSRFYIGDFLNGIRVQVKAKARNFPIAQNPKFLFLSLLR